MTFTKAGGLLALTTALLVAGCQKKPVEPPKVTLSEDQKAIYAFGTALGRQLGEQAKPLRLTAEEKETFRNGVSDSLTGKAPEFKIEDYEARFRQLAQARVAAGAEEARKNGADFLAKAAKEQGATVTTSGLVYRTVTAGKGAHPKATDKVKVNYEGRLTDGTVFDSSIKRGEHAEFVLNQVIPCWTEGVQRMAVGEKAQFVCPAGIAYGDRGAGGGAIPPGATLVFDVELLEILKP
jgi:FKBP-type peptidyl-prolyl cis-trans isomerase FkpA